MDQVGCRLPRDRQQSEIFARAPRRGGHEYPGVAPGKHRVSPSLRLGVTLSEEHLRRGNLAEAFKSAKAAVDADPDSPKALSNLAHALTKLDRMADSIAVLMRVVAMSPRLTPQRHVLVSLLLKTGRLEEARSQLLAALVVEDHWKTNLFVQLEFYNKLGDDAEALNAAKRAAELAPDQPSASEWLRRLTEAGPSSSSSVPRLLSAIKSLRPLRNRRYSPGG